MLHYAGFVFLTDSFLDTDCWIVTTQANKVIALFKNKMLTKKQVSLMRMQWDVTYIQPVTDEYVPAWQSVHFAESEAPAAQRLNRNFSKSLDNSQAVRSQLIPEFVEYVPSPQAIHVLASVAPAYKGRHMMVYFVVGIQMANK